MGGCVPKGAFHNYGVEEDLADDGPMPNAPPALPTDQPEQEVQQEADRIIHKIYREFFDWLLDQLKTVPFNIPTEVQTRMSKGQFNEYWKAIYYCISQNLWQEPAVSLPLISPPIWRIQFKFDSWPVNGHAEFPYMHGYRHGPNMAVADMSGVVTKQAVLRGIVDSLYGWKGFGDEEERPVLERIEYKVGESGELVGPIELLCSGLKNIKELEHTYGAKGDQPEL